MDNSSTKPRILAVDDSRVMRVAMKKILGGSYDVLEAEHGEDAWTILINDPSILVVFTDLSMPYLDGFGLLERMRQSEDERLREMPVIIITGKDDDDETKQRALDKGASDFITKPFESVHLQARAKAHIKFNQTSSQLVDISGKLEKQAAVDELTGLGGQRYFYRVTEETNSYIRRHGGQLVLLRMDLDDFNLVFIKHGKTTADAIIKTTGQQLAKFVRKEDMLARIGLAKFGMLLRDTPLATAEQLAERMRQMIANLQFNLGQLDKLRITASIGIFEPDPKINLDVKLQISMAEKCLAEAVRAGGNRIMVASEQSTINSELVNLETALTYIQRSEEQKLRPLSHAIILRLLPLLNYLANEVGGEFKALVDKINATYTK
jgi:diguanylate cyclase (GGDEF)-like protein